MAGATVRRYEARAAPTETFGRLLCSVRDQRFVVDGPVHNDCPGEAVTPAELFLAGVASCAVELIQSLARKAGIPLQRIRSEITGEMDPDRPEREDVTVFSSVALTITFAGVTAAQAGSLVESFKGR